MKNLYHVFLVMLIIGSVVFAQETIVDFEDLDMSFWNGSTGGFTSGSATFNNNYNAAWQSWDGWAYSNRTDTTTEGFTAQYNAIAGSGQNGSVIYGIGYVNSFAPEPPKMMLSENSILDGAYFTNVNYTYYSMLKGDAFSKKFGGSNGTDPDWLKLIIDGLNSDGTPTGTRIEFYLADFRFVDDSMDYIIDEWTFVDLSELGTVSGLSFTMESSDVGDFGINTPTYFAMDTVSVPEPMMAVLLGAGGIFLRRKRCN